MGIQHNEQSLRASTLVDDYCALKGEYDCLESTITDLITDVLILAHMEGIDIGSVFRMASYHVSAETELVETQEEASWPE